MKIAFLPFLTQHGPTFWSTKGQNMEFLKQNFNFQFLTKTKVILLPSMWIKDWLAIVKASKIVTFCYFWPRMGKHFVLIFFRYGVSGKFSLEFLLRYLYNHYLLACKFIPHAKYEKKSQWNTSFFFFFTTLDQLWPKSGPKYHTHFTFFGWFFMKYIRRYN